jgi:Uma2 family endonuclease
MVIERSRVALPDHTQLPESDGNFVKNFQEHPQSLLLTDSIVPHLQQLHRDGQYCIGQDSGIYWRLTEPLERGAEAPDWFYVANVPPTLNGKMRRSYVLWKELVPPVIVLEFVSGDGEEERDTTPYQGKFWIYENMIKAQYYGIFEVQKASVEVYQLGDKGYIKVVPNHRGHYPIQEMGVELGIWRGNFLLDKEIPWLRWWDENGNLLLTGSERAVVESQRAQTVEQENARLRAQLRALGFDPDALK